MNKKPFTNKSIALYVLMQLLVLVFCWGWFATLWSMAFFSYDYDQIEWWLLFSAALAGLYGLRPNLERAVDYYWLGKGATQQVLKERAAQLMPVKKRLDLVFSLVLIVVLAVFLVVAGTSWLNSPPSQGSQ